MGWAQRLLVLVLASRAPELLISTEVAIASSPSISLEAAGNVNQYPPDDADGHRLGRRATSAQATLVVGNPSSNGCGDLDLSQFDKGKACGTPLTLPCFDNSRCVPPPHGTGPTIYVYDKDCSLADSAELSQAGEIPGDPSGHIMSDHFVAWYWRKAAKEQGVLAETYESACLFIHVSRAGDPCATKAPLWNGGMNHVMIDFSDSTRDRRPEVAASFAMEAASNMHTCYYRSGYDISLPLDPENVFPKLADIGPLGRKYFATFKGAVYLAGHGSEERMSVLPINDEENGVIMSTHCHDHPDKVALPEDFAFCADLQERFDDHDYQSLMNTTFAIVPAGRSVGTYRLAEVMSAGAIPVFVARDIVRPFREQFDWTSFSLVFAPDQVGPSMIKTLRAITPKQLKGMQRKSLKAYKEMFGPGTRDFDVIAHNVVHILRKRIGHH